MDSARFWKGFGWGVVATIAMSVLMIAGLLTGMSPMPKPIPLAIMGKVLGMGTPKPMLMLLGAASHLAYGGFWGGVVASLTSPVTVKKGLSLGIALWLGMQIVVLPFLGWGVFGLGVTPAIAVATLVLHLVYGATYGGLMDRHARPAP